FIDSLVHQLVQKEITANHQKHQDDQPCPGACTKKRYQNVFSESSRIVTGPLFTSSTSIMAWNCPVSQRRPAARILSTKYSYSRLASSGLAAASNDGRLPRRTSPYRVNCETTSTAPSNSCTER